MLKLSEYWEMLNKLQSETNKMADEVQLIHKKMQGRGVNPAEAPLTISKLEDIEHRLRMLGANKDNPVPFGPRSLV